MKTPLYHEHEKLDAKLVDFHGWMMPIQYSTGILKEHHAVRTAAGIFDVSHMGEILINGGAQSRSLQKLCTNDISTINIGKSVYTHILNEKGAIIDDTIVFKTGDEQYLMVPNAASIDKIHSWLNKNISEGVNNLSNSYSCLAVQGPKSADILSKIFGQGIRDIGRFKFAYYNVISTNSDNIEIDKDIILPSNDIDFEVDDIITVSGTGYTGEEGMELIIKNEHAVPLWNLLFKIGAGDGLIPIGLGARDTLRLEMGYLLSGTDFTGSHSSLESNCSWVVKWDHDFIGKDVLVKQKEEKLHQRLVGIMLEGKGVARPGAQILPPIGIADPSQADNQFPQETEGSPPRSDIFSSEPIGTVTSGNFSPSLEKAIALARIDRKYAKAGTELILQQGKRKFNGIVTRLPFLKK